MKARILRDESGFTLPEMMVTMVMMIVVFFALHNIFDMSIRVFRVGNDKVETVENARLGLAKMEREIRAAYPVKGPTSTGADRYRFFNAEGLAIPSKPPTPIPTSMTSSQITFGNELNNSTQPNGNQQIDCNPSGAASGAAGYTPCEYITYRLVGNTLMRNNTISGSTSSTGNQPVVEYVAANGLQFRYFTSDGTEINPVSPGSLTQTSIARVEISLQIAKDGRNQNLTTEVDLRNPGEVS